LLIVFRHAARQMPSWLIFDVGQNMRVTILSLICGAVAFAAESVPEERSAVFPREQALQFVHTVCHSIPDDITGFWSPAVSELKGIETALPPFLKKVRPELLEWLGGVYEGQTRWTWLRRQAAGVIKGDDRLLLVSYVCEYPPESAQREKEMKVKTEKMGRRYDEESWKKKPLFVHDGGMSYFRVLFDPAKREFTWYQENKTP
jgi:hypothetical protein